MAIYFVCRILFAKFSKKNFASTISAETFSNLRKVCGKYSGYAAFLIISLENAALLQKNKISKSRALCGTAEERGTELRRNTMEPRRNTERTPLVSGLSWLVIYYCV